MDQRLLLLHRNGPASHHTSSGKSSHLHTSEQNKSLTVLFTVPLRKGLPAVLLLWLYRNPTISHFLFDTPVFLPVALSLCNAYPHPRSSFIFLLHTMHYKDIVSQAVSRNILVREGKNSTLLKNTRRALPLLSY